MYNNIQKIISYFNAISLQKVCDINLMNRIDTKFIFNITELNDILKKASKKYNILEINNSRILDYKTQYFDTKNFDMYLAHQNKKLNRFKIRKRKYMISNIIFFEIKFKSNKGRTIKERIKIKNFSNELSDDIKKFIERKTSFNCSNLRQSLLIDFSRITLIHKKQKEKITIDININYKYNTKNINLPFLVITEVKSEKHNKSDFIEILKKQKIYKQNISKYTIGILLLNKGIKYNNFKEKLLTLSKIANNDKYNYVFNKY